jgi:hypothetical protein
MPIQVDYRTRQKRLERGLRLSANHPISNFSPFGVQRLQSGRREMRHSIWDYFSLRGVGLMIRRSFGPAVLLAFGNHHLAVGEYDL